MFRHNQYSMFVKKLVILVLLGTVPGMAFTQKNKKKKKEEIASAAKEFLDVCNLYKRIPLRLEVEMTQTATIRTSPQDSSTVKASFFLTEKEAYTRFGNTEQIVSDSLILMVSIDRPMMMVFNNQQDVRTSLNNYMGFQISDSVMKNLHENYAAEYIPGINAGEKVIELKHKLALPGTDIVKEIITVKYSERSKEPSELVYIRRTLIPIDKNDLNAFNSFPGKLITIGENSFLLNERRSISVYKIIDHDPGIRLPVRISDRIKKNEQGKFVPASGFEHYYVNLN